MNEERREYQPHYYEDEIDLYELWLKLKKRWRVILFTTLSFLFLALLYIILTPKVYESSFVVKIPTAEDKPILSPRETTKYIRYLEELIKARKYDKLSKALNMKEVENILSIKGREIRGVKDSLEISVEVRDPELIPPLAKAILRYLNDNEFIKSHLRRKREALTFRKRALEEELRSLQSLQKSLLKESPDAEKISELAKLIADIKQEIIDTEIALRSLRGFTLSVEPFVPDTPSKPKSLLVLVVAGVSGLFMGIFVALFLEWLEEARRRHENLSQDSN